jgi:acyl-homoserine lactone synthase
MIVIEKQRPPQGPDSLLAAMFEARKQVFVDLLGWDVPVLEQRFEIDQFDDEHATYIILSGVEGAHRASARLLKTTRPHILDGLFPHLCAGPVPSGPDVLEITRFCLDRKLGAVARREARNQLVSALVVHALEHNVRTFTGVAEMAWLQQILAFGWVCRPLGIPATVNGRPTGALAIEIDEQTPLLLERNGIWAEPFSQAAALAEAA